MDRQSKKNMMTREPIQGRGILIIIGFRETLCFMFTNKEHHFFLNYDKLRKQRRDKIISS